ncbi:MAG: hypothetical protein ACRDD1_00535 [Planctomycetia bacterium]
MLSVRVPRSFMFCCLVSAVLLAGAVGCGDDPASKMGRELGIPSWAELDALDPAMGTIGMSIDYGSVSGISNLMKTSKSQLQEKLKAFEAASIPSRYDTAARREAKVKYLAAMQALMEPGNRNPTQWKEQGSLVMDRLRDLRKPD